MTRRRTPGHGLARALLASALAGQLACATSGAAPEAPKPVPAGAAEGVVLCEHGVPADECTKHHPELIANYKRMNDWCPEHDVPESHCLACHPGLTFAPLPKLPPDADFEHTATMGEDVPSLAAHAAPGKVTVFDFYANWCAPCKKVDAHVYGLLITRKDLAYRKLNIMSWDTPLAHRYLTEVPSLPYVVVLGRDGRQVAAISGLDLTALDAAIAAGAQP